MERRRERLNDALNNISRAIREDRKVRRGAISNDLEVLLNESRIVGLSGDQIDILCNVIRSSFVGNGIRIAVIKCLLPSQTVPVNSVLSLLSWMNTKDATKNIQALLLRWITAIFEMINDIKPLHSVYPLLFFYIKCDTLRKHACPLLVMLTKKEDVVGFRVNRLMKLRANLGNDPHLNDILSLYKFYCPHLVPIRLRTSLKKRLASPYYQWTSYISKIQQLNAGSVDKNRNLYLNSRAFWESEDAVPPTGPPVSRKEKYSGNLPGMMDNVGEQLEVDKRVVPAHSISSFVELKAAIDRVQLPLQTLIVLRYPVLQNIMSYLREKEHIIRFGYNLNMILYNDFRTESKVMEVKAERMMLSKLIQFSQYLKEGIPVVDNFLTCYLNLVWNGQEFADHILKLLTWTRMKSFEDLKDILLPLKKLFYSYDVNFKVTVLYSLCELLGNFLHLEMARHQRFTLTSSTFLNPTDAMQYLYLFVEEQDDFSPYDTIVSLMEFINELIAIGIVIEDCDTLILHAAASFYKMVVDFYLEKDFHYFQLPPPIFIYAAFTSLDVILLSQLCSILISCREAIYKNRRRAKSEKQPLQKKTEQHIKMFNCYISDLMNSLWCQKAFSIPLANPFSIYEISPEARQKLFEEDASNVFSVYHHPAISPFAFTYQKTVSSLPPMKTSVSQALMEGSSLHNYFMFLSEAGLDSVPQLITLFAKT